MKIWKCICVCVCVLLQPLPQSVVSLLLRVLGKTELRRSLLHERTAQLYRLVADSVFLRSRSHLAQSIASACCFVLFVLCVNHVFFVALCVCVPYVCLYVFVCVCVCVCVCVYCVCLCACVQFASSGAQSLDATVSYFESLTSLLEELLDRFPAEAHLLPIQPLLRVTAKVRCFIWNWVVASLRTYCCFLVQLSCCLWCIHVRSCKR